MAWSFGESWDLYANPADMVNGYWDSGTNPGSPSLNTGRFAGSRCYQVTPSTTVTKISNVNDAVHHFVVAFYQTAAISGSTLGLYLQLLDGATGQCAVVFRSDGAILLTSGTAVGTVLATYTGAVTTNNTWYAFEIEVVINNTTGSFTVRKNGNTSNDFTLGSLNTRGGTANNYANRLVLSQSSNVSIQQIDDLFWRSDASSVAWMGDIRCYTRMPTSDASVQFSRSTGGSNFSCVDEAQQNTATDYVYDSTPGHADFYGIGAIASTPVSTIAVVSRAYMQKSDAGTRTAAVQIKSGGTTVASPTLTLTTSGWQWTYRTDVTDPATSAAWTATAVNNAQIGPATVA